MKYKFKTKPSNEQLEALRRALKRKRFGVFFQQRVGKTKVSIDFIGALSMHGVVKKALIVCPLSVMDVWVSEIEAHMPDGIQRRVSIFPEKVKQREVIIKEGLGCEVLHVLIINYDKLFTQADLLKQYSADVIIFDEAHLTKRHTSNRSKASAILSQKAPYVLALTGTPIPKKWYDVFGLFRVLDHEVFGKSWYKFVAKHGIKGGFMGKQIVGCVDYDRIADIIASASMRVIRKDVMHEPEVENLIIPVELKKTTMAMYKDLSKRYMLELETGVMTADLPIVRATRLQQFCGGFAKTDEGNVVKVHLEKVHTLVDLVHTHMEADEKVVVFHRFREEGFAIADALRARGYNVGEYNGSTSREARTDMLVDFQHDDVDVIVIQISTGVMGITLDRAHINIFYSLDFSLSNFQQARDRVMGRGQKHDVTNYFLAVKGTVDHKIMNALKNDEDVATLIQDKWRWMFAD